MSLEYRIKDLELKVELLTEKLHDLELRHREVIRCLAGGKKS